MCVYCVYVATYKLPNSLIPRPSYEKKFEKGSGSGRTCIGARGRVPEECARVPHCQSINVIVQTLSFLDFFFIGESGYQTLDTTDWNAQAHSNSVATSFSIATFIHHPYSSAAFLNI